MRLINLLVVVAMAGCGSPKKANKERREVVESRVIPKSLSLDGLDLPQEIDNECGLQKAFVGWFAGTYLKKVSLVAERCDFGKNGEFLSNEPGVQYYCPKDRTCSGLRYTIKDGDKTLSLGSLLVATDGQWRNGMVHEDEPSFIFLSPLETTKSYYTETLSKSSESNLAFLNLTYIDAVRR